MQNEKGFFVSEKNYEELLLDAQRLCERFNIDVDIEAWLARPASLSDEERLNWLISALKTNPRELKSELNDYAETAIKNLPSYKKGGRN